MGLPGSSGEGLAWEGGSALSPMMELGKGHGEPQHLQNFTKTFLVSSNATCSKVFPTRTLTGRVSQSSGGIWLSRWGCGDNQDGHSLW